MNEETEIQDASYLSEDAGTDVTEAAEAPEVPEVPDDYASVEDESQEDEDGDENGIVVFDADAEDAAERARQLQVEVEPIVEEEALSAVRSMSELMSIIEALIFVADEPLNVKTMAEVLKEDKGWIQTAVEALAVEFNERNGGLHLREVAGGWQMATRAEHHEHVRAFLKSRPSAKLSLASLETLAVIAYKQPITVPEILEIRGVHSSSAIKTLLDKRLIVAKGRKETVGRPMMYGTSKDFLLQFGLKDLSELPNVEDFEDLASGAS
jgi:segregation and condensation protein B